MNAPESGAQHIREQYNQNMKLKQIFDSNYHLFQQQIMAHTTPHYPNNIITKIKNDGVSQIYMCTASSIIFQMQEQDTLYQMLALTIDPKSSGSYYFVLLNDGANNQTYRAIKNVFLKLPIAYYEKLVNFIIVKLSIYERMWEFFSQSQLHTILKQKSVMFETLKEVCEFLSISENQLIGETIETSQQFPEPIHELSYLKTSQNVEIRNKDQQKMDILFDRILEIDDYEMSTKGIPLFLQIMMNYFKQQPVHLEADGLFRKCVVQQDLTDTINHLKTQGYDYIFQIENPHIVANLMKRFLSTLKYLLIPQQQFNKLMQIPQHSTFQILKAILESIPLINYVTLKQTLCFLRDYVNHYSGFNKMTIHSIAIIFAPCLMKAETKGHIQLDYAIKSANLCEILLRQYDFFFTNKKVGHHTQEVNLKGDQQKHQPRLKSIRGEKNQQDPDSQYKNLKEKPKSFSKESNCTPNLMSQCFFPRGGSHHKPKKQREQLNRLDRRQIIS